MTWFSLWRKVYYERNSISLSEYKEMNLASIVECCMVLSKIGGDWHSLFVLLQILEA
jgi:hypothetical protein